MQNGPPSPAQSKQSQKNSYVFTRFCAPCNKHCRKTGIFANKSKDAAGRSVVSGPGNYGDPHHDKTQRVCEPAPKA